MTIPEDPSEREIFLAHLGTSDEDVESLMSGGADVDDLIAAGVLDATEPCPQEEEEFVIDSYCGRSLGLVYSKSPVV